MLDAAGHRPEWGANPAGFGAGAGICRLDRLHRFEAVSPQAARLFGLSEAELLGSCLWDRFPTLRESELHRCCLALTPGRGLPLDAATEEAAGPGPRDFLLHFVPLDRWYIVVASAVQPAGTIEIRLSDVTDTPGGIAARIRAERLDAAAQAMGRLSHDINNCLTVIMGNAEYLEEMLAGHHDLAEAIRFVGQAAERAATLTGRVLQFSRRAAPPADETGLEAVLERLESRLRILASGQRIEVSAGAGLPAVLADPAALEAALHELAVNALEAMPDGGTLRILAQDAGEGRIAITLSDSGRGMGAAMLDRCVEPFVSTKDAHWGVGMGLSSVYGFATASGGALHLQSHPGKGTRAMLELPAAPRPLSEALGEAASPRPEEHVLLVDDDPAGRAGISRLLGALGYAVTAVASAAEALETLRTDRPAPSLLLADVIMPGGLDGPRLVAEARRMHPALPALLMSGYAAHPGGAAVQDNGIRLLPKPFRKAELARALNDELRPHRRR